MGELPSDLIVSPFVLTALVLGLIGISLLLAGATALRKRRPGRFAFRTLSGLLMATLGALAATIGVGMQGFRALTHEALAAEVRVEPIGPQRFIATVLVPGRRPAIYDISGDAIYLDAQILKWKSVANLIGLHTAYELDRVGGRYDDIEQERGGARTIYSLVNDRPVDLFSLRRRYTFLEPLLDAEYGSGTFAPVSRRATFEVRVSTTGLLIREVPPEPSPPAP